MRRTGSIAPLIALSALGCSFESDGVPDVIDAAVPRSLGGTDGFCEGDPGRPRVLVYTFENLWRHQSNLTARGLVYSMCESRGFTVTATNDPRAINATRLAEADVVVFSVTSGNGLDAASKAELEAWIRGGGGVVGLEAAAATEMDWPFFIDNLGAAFAGHAPGFQRATVRIESATHPITAGLPASFVVTEQWYVFDRRPEEVPGVEVLLALDESTLPPDYPDEYRRGYHAIGWTLERFGGRTFYTGLGDNPEGFEHPTQVELIGRAIEWAARRR